MSQQKPGVNYPAVKNWPTIWRSGFNAEFRTILGSGQVQTTTDPYDNGDNLMGVNQLTPATSYNTQLANQLPYPMHGPSFPIQPAHPGGVSIGTQITPQTTPQDNQGTQEGLNTNVARPPLGASGQLTYQPNIQNVLNLIQDNGTSDDAVPATQPPSGLIGLFPGNELQPVQPQPTQPLPTPMGLPQPTPKPTWPAGARPLIVPSDRRPSVKISEGSIGTIDPSSLILPPINTDDSLVPLIKAPPAPSSVGPVNDGEQPNDASSVAGTESTVPLMTADAQTQTPPPLMTAAAQTQTPAVPMQVPVQTRDAQVGTDIEGQGKEDISDTVLRSIQTKYGGLITRLARQSGITDKQLARISAGRTPDGNARDIVNLQQIWDQDTDSVSKEDRIIAMLILQQRTEMKRVAELKEREEEERAARKRAERKRAEKEREEEERAERRAEKKRAEKKSKHKKLVDSDELDD